MLRKYGAFEEELVLNFLYQALRGIQYLHAQDIIHRDIKGANLLVSNNGTVKLSDFGISQEISTSESKRLLRLPLMI